uniref:Photosystem II reaction center protein X n=1 Tax=Sciadococcus taiwanensis TaxID=3028030 RepID=A0A9Y1I294_9RHOD|nr:photosystem II protein X [Sciadococcus taiwanensis]
MTSSLSAFFSSLVWGTVIVILPISVALFWVSQTDKVRRDF